MNPFRILLVCEPAKDGAFNFLAGFASHVLRAHPECTIDLAYSSLRSGPGLQPLVDEVRRRGGVAIDLEIGNAPGLADFGAAFRLLRLIRLRRPRIVHLVSSKAGGIGRLVGLLPGMPPTIYTPQAYFGMARLGGRREMFFNALERLLGRVGWTHNCSSDEMEFARDALGVGEDRLKVVDNGIPSGRFAPLQDEERARERERLGIPADAVVVATVGRVCHQKYYELLYDALDPLLARGTHFLVHAGLGCEELSRTRLGEAARARGLFFDQHDHPNELLGIADLYALLSRYEGYPLSLLEASASGLPAILARTPGLAHFARRQVEGTMWVEAGTHEEMVASARGGIDSFRLESSEARLRRSRFSRTFVDVDDRAEELYQHMRTIMDAANPEG